jgi:hypothetical protein
VYAGNRGKKQMTNSTSARPEEPADPLDQTLFYVSDEEAKQLGEALSSPPPPTML